MGKKLYRLKSYDEEINNNERKPLKLEIKKDDNINLSKNLVHQIQFTIISVFITMVVGLLSTYAIFTAVHKSKGKNIINVGTLRINYDKNNLNKLTLKNTHPKSDSDGLKQKPYKFTIYNDGSLDANYSIRVVDDYVAIAEDGCNNNMLNNSYIKLSLNNSYPYILGFLKDNNYTLEEGVIKSGELKEYNVKLWVSKQIGKNITNKHYHGKIVVDGVSLINNSK